MLAPAQCVGSRKDFPVEYLARKQPTTAAGGRKSLRQQQILADALRLGDPGAELVTASGGHSDNTHFGGLLANGAATFFAPHLARTSDWDTQTGIRLDLLRDNNFPPSAAIHLQENNRRADRMDPNAPPCSTDCEEEDFRNAVRLASEFGAAGWVFHTDAGYRLDLPGGFQSELDSEEVATLDCDQLGVIDCLVEEVSESRCAPSRLVSADFEGDPAGGTADEPLVNHATDRGVQKWRASTDTAVDLRPENNAPGCLQAPMFGDYATTNNESSNATAWVPLVIPEGFTGKVVVEADLTVGTLVPLDSAVMSLGFLSDEGCEVNLFTVDCSFVEKGEIWLEQTPAGVLFYDSQGIVGVMDLPNLLTPKVRKWRLVYDYGAGELTVALDGGAPTTVGGPIAIPSIRAVGFEILTGTAGLSGVDNFTAEVIP